MPYQSSSATSDVSFARLGYRMIGYAAVRRARQDR